MCSIFVALTAFGANITSFVPFLQIGGVPITLQTYFCILSGTILGSRLGATAMSVYLFAGVIGLPIFAGFKGGIGAIFSPTFGFIISFIAVAYVTGKWIEWKQNPSLLTFITASFLGLIFNYVIGTNYMYLALTYWLEAPAGFSYAQAWLIMLAYLPVDVLTIFIAGLTAPKVHRALHKTNKSFAL
ncbi:BioY family transporter [Virgibacillus phasianinus]|uniref:Biotin transporter n=2 Tax=Virgibacillus phasianinus TaxID=2017483 RepID=A0A220U8P7_9BACI|nr:biotin transporter BioY [Virgibacillus phasianinus]ASK64460.1 BioY family transporter [Virgibacillus phasianinus]